MSNYATSSTSAITVSPSSTYQVRIARIEANGIISSASASMGIAVKVFPSSTASSGSTATVLAMQTGAPATTATVKTGATISGTSITLHTELIAVNSTGDVPTSLNTNYTFPFELILSSGATFQLSPTGNAPTMIVYFEEIRTPRTL